MAEREVGRSAAGCVQFGDGIVSAINFSIQLEKKPHPAGDRPIHQGCQWNRRRPIVRCRSPISAYVRGTRITSRLARIKSATQEPT
jgi:hypothetical protein